MNRSRVLAFLALLFLSILIAGPPIASADIGPDIKISSIGPPDLAISTVTGLFTEVVSWGSETPAPILAQPDITQVQVASTECADNSNFLKQFHDAAIGSSRQYGKVLANAYTDETGAKIGGTAPLRLRLYTLASIRAVFPVPLAHTAGPLQT